MGYLKTIFCRRHLGPLCLIPLLAALLLFPAGARASKAVKGVLDLTAWDFQNNVSVNLDGEWEFYWQQLLAPQDFDRSAPPPKTGFFNVPGYWNGYVADGKKLKGEGFATFRLNVRIKPGREKMAVRIDSQATSYRLWVNGKLISQNGVVGTRRSAATPQYLVRSPLSITPPKASN